MHTDPSDHTRMRSQINAPFMPRRVAALEPAFRAIVRKQFARISDREEADAFADLAQTVATRVTSALLNLPERDAPELEAIVTRIFAREPGTVGLPESSVAAFGDLDTYFLEMVRERRRNPTETEDMLNRHLSVEISDGRSSDEEIASFMTTLLCFPSAEVGPLGDLS